MPKIYQKAVCICHWAEHLQTGVTVTLHKSPYLSGSGPSDLQIDKVQRKLWVPMMTWNEKASRFLFTQDSKQFVGEVVQLYSPTRDSGLWGTALASGSSPCMPAAGWSMQCGLYAVLLGRSFPAWIMSPTWTWIFPLVNLLFSILRTYNDS